MLALFIVGFSYCMQSQPMDITRIKGNPLFMSLSAGDSCPTDAVWQTPQGSRLMLDIAVAYLQANPEINPNTEVQVRRLAKRQPTSRLEASADPNPVQTCARTAFILIGSGICAVVGAVILLKDTPKEDRFPGSLVLVAALFYFFTKWREEHRHDEVIHALRGLNRIATDTSAKARKLDTSKHTPNGDYNV